MLQLAQSQQSLIGHLVNSMQYNKTNTKDRLRYKRNFKNDSKESLEET